MKKILFAALAATMLFASCDKENGVDTPVDEGHKATLTVNVGGSTKASGQDNDEEGTGNASVSVIKNFSVFAFRANGLLDCPVFSSVDGVTAATSGVDAATTAVTELYVVANTGSISASFASVTNKSQLMDILATLPDFPTNIGAEGILATGVETITSVDFDANYKVTKNVQLTFVPARINVKVINKMHNRDASGALELTHTAVLNAVSTSKLFSATASLIPDTYSYFAGISTPEEPSGVTVKTFLQDAYTMNAAEEDTVTGEIGDYNHYYVFENDGLIDATIITLVAEMGGDTVYFPVHFTLADAEKVLTRGNSYDVTITLTGNADPNGTDPTDPPVVPPTDPFEPIVNATIDVTVTVAKWVPQTINKEF